MTTTWSKKLTFRVIIDKKFPRVFGARLFSYNSLQLEIPWNILGNTLKIPWKRPGIWFHENCSNPDTGNDKMLITLNVARFLSPHDIKNWVNKEF